MKEATLKLKIRIGNVGILSDNTDLDKIVLNAILSAFGALALLYVLILGNMVFNIIERKALEKEALALSSEVGKLELTYLSLSGTLDEALSASLGFKETKASFAARKSLGIVKQDGNEI